MTAIGRKTFLTLSLSLAVAAGTESGGLRVVVSQRPRPPIAVKCSRDHLTAFQGRILEYTRSRQEISLRVRTDEATTESFTLRWEASEKVETWLLLNGEAFKAEDWNRIESAAGKIRDGVRIIVWDCDDGSKPVLDWRPAAN